MQAYSPLVSKVKQLTDVPQGVDTTNEFAEGTFREISSFDVISPVDVPALPVEPVNSL